MHARRIRIAEDLICGKPLTAIAAQEGISRQWAYDEAKSSTVQQIIVGIVNAQREQLLEIFGGMLDAIKASFGARRIVRKRAKDADGNMKMVLLDLGPDHEAALAGVKQFIRLLTAGRAGARG